MNGLTNHNFEAALEAELTIDDEKEPIMQQPSATVTQIKPAESLIPAGPFKGVSVKEATASVMQKNSSLPTALLSQESEAARLKLQEATASLARLTAEHEVRIKSFGGIFEERLDSNKQAINELAKQIMSLNSRINDLTVANNHILEEKAAKISAANAQYEEEVRSAKQLIAAWKTLVENLATSVN